MTVKYTGLIVASRTLPQNYTKTYKRTTKQQKRKKRKTNSHSHFQDESKKEEWRGEEERRTGFLFSHPPSSILRLFLLSLSNFRLIVRLEQLAAPVHVISEVTNFHRHNPGFMLSKGKYTEAAYWEFSITWSIYTLNTDPLGSLGAIMKSLQLLSQEIPP